MSEVTVTPETKTATDLFTARIACATHAAQIRMQIPDMTPAQKAIAVAVITSRLKLASAATEKDLGKVLDIMIDRVGRGLLNPADTAEIIKPVAAIIEAHDWPKLINLLQDGPKEGTPAETPIETPKPEPVAAPPMKIELSPEVPPVHIPDVVINPADPMSVMASAMARHLAPVMEATARANDAMAMNSIRPVFDALTNRLNSIESRPQSSGSVDEAKVAEIISRKLNNGTGDELRKAIAGAAPGLLTDLLSRAADAVATQEIKVEAGAAQSALFVPDEDPCYYWPPHLEAMATLLTKAAESEPQNALLVGPTGSGKTASVEQFAARRKSPMMIMDCGNLREAREWFGSKGAANGSTYFRRSQFWEAVSRGSVVILLDELNRLPAQILNPLMPLLDHRRQSFVEEVGETLKVGSGTIFFATINEGLDYAGTHVIDRALKNRFPRRIEVGYLDEKHEKNVIMGRVPGLSEQDATNLVELAGTIRAKATGISGGLSETMSTRQLIAVATDYVIGGPETFVHTIFNHYPSDGGKDSERAQVINMFELKGYRI